MAEVEAITKMQDFIKWLLPQVAKLPRSHKFTLGDRIINLSLDVLELLIEAAYTKNKQPILRQSNLQLEKLRHLIRLCYELQLIGLNRYEHASKEINEAERCRQERFMGEHEHTGSPLRS